MDSIICGICQQHVYLSKGGFLDYDNCTHYTHISCNSVEDKDLECPICNPLAISAKNIKELPEPDWNGEDWVSHPIANSAKLQHYWTVGTDYFKKRTEDIENAQTLLSKKMPIEWIIRNKQWGLPHMYSQGVKLVDFLQNNYTIGDLCKYKDIGKKGPERALNTLRVLGLTPEMLIDYKHLLPIETLREKVNLVALDISSKKTGGGLWFNGDVLRSVGKENWTLDDIIYLGFKFKDLQKCGLDCKSQWENLEDGHSVTPHELKLLKCTQKDIDALVGDDIEQDHSFEETLPKEIKIITEKLKKEPTKNNTLIIRKILKDKK
jgi:hypothetical protein